MELFSIKKLRLNMSFAKWLYFFQVGMSQKHLIHCSGDLCCDYKHGIAFHVMVSGLYWYKLCSWINCYVVQNYVHRYAPPVIMVWWNWMYLLQLQIFFKRGFTPKCMFYISILLTHNVAWMSFRLIWYANKHNDLYLHYSKCDNSAQ